MKPLGDFQDILPFLKPGSSVVLHSACAEPQYLVSQLAAHANVLRDVRLYTLMPMGKALYAAPNANAAFLLSTFFPGKGLREAANAGRVDVLRISLGSIPKLFQDRVLTADVLLLQLSPPDDIGRMSLGLSVDYMRAVLAQDPIVVAEINPLIPQTCGDTIIREDEVDYVTESRDTPQIMLASGSDRTDKQIADHIAALISNGAVIQAGIGSLPDMVLGQLGHLRDLGIHSGMITDSLIPLIERGVVTNATKKHFRGKCITTIAAGSQSFYDKLHRNSLIEFHPCSLTHNVDVIAGIDGFCAINSVLQIDLAGRANAERVDGKIISTPGGLPDFARGASMAKGGMSIIALRSTSKDGRRSNIVPELASDTPFTVTSDDIDYVVTEHGVAKMRGLDSISRAQALIAIAHPDLRTDLRRGATNRPESTACGSSDVSASDFRRGSP